MLSGKARFMVGLIVIYAISDFFLTPLGGLETRDVAKVSTTGLATLGLLFTGLALNIICLILLLRHYRRAPIFGIIGSFLYFPAPIAEATGQFSSLMPPTAIATLEVIEAILAIAIIATGVMVLRERPATQVKPA
jgi:hypothetical protein